MDDSILRDMKSEIEEHRGRIIDTEEDVRQVIERLKRFERRIGVLEGDGRMDEAGIKIESAASRVGQCEQDVDELFEAIKGLTTTMRNINTALKEFGERIDDLERIAGSILYGILHTLDASGARIMTMQERKPKS